MSEPNSGNCDRHCAFCLKFLPAGTAKVCGKCHRRAYCSRDCQKADWSKKWGSQGHKNWCDLGCGEEDIDWEVKPVEGKGIGIVAKRFIPAKFRIMIDACRLHDHPVVNDLMPIGGTLFDKLRLNLLQSKQTKEDLLCLRISRVNLNDPTYNVEILYAERDIQPGEEITIAYVSLKEIDKTGPLQEAFLSAAAIFGDNGLLQQAKTIFGDSPLQQVKAILRMKWGIVCKKDNCFCRDENMAKIVEEIPLLLDRFRSAMSPEISENAMEIARMIIEKLEKIGERLTGQMYFLSTSFMIGIARRSTLNEAKEYARQAYEIAAALMHPNSEVVLEFKRHVEIPHLLKNYLRLEK